MDNVRVRFAPSPTGSFHVGGARTALYDKIIATAFGGSFIWRVEDTDQNRFVSSATNELINALTWLNLNWDEGPTTDELLDLGVDQITAQKYGKKDTGISYVQSKRKDIYWEYAMELVDRGKAYPVFSGDGEEMESGKKKDYKFANTAKALELDKWRSNSRVMAKKLINTGKPFHLRVKMPREDGITCHDRLRGEIYFKFYQQFDRVILKTDKMPTYHFASVVDDHLMQITHVLRGEEWISSLPVHQFLYDCFEWSAPEFIHIGIILNPNGKGKMSKRKLSVSGLEDIPVFVKEHAEKGFLPEALNNFMLLTGWSPGNDVEFMSMDEAATLFKKESILDGKITNGLDRLSRTGAAWNYNKLLYMNQKYISKMDKSDFAMEAIKFL